ncbi:MAG: SagB/ThcOx family dehydrogenase [Pseudomonadota bacterium]
MSMAVAAVRAYHRLSKHHLQAYAPGPSWLDWDTQPDPYRRYSGAPLIPLPLMRDSCPSITYDALYAPGACAPESFTPETLGLFMELAFGLSAWKSSGPDRWALRNNPSSGNLHPGEAYLLLWRRASSELGPGLYHYAPREHALELRAVLPEEDAACLRAAHPGGFGALGLSSVLWREAWKYGARAFRYVQLDTGHALACARFSAAVLGWSLVCDVVPGDGTVAACLGLDRPPDFADAEQEWPEWLAVLGEAVCDDVDWPLVARALTDWRGRANRLSTDHVVWPQIETVLPAVCKPEGRMGSVREPSRRLESGLRDRGPKACDIIRKRRSAQRMDGMTSIPRGAFERMLERTLPVSGRAPFDALPFPPALDLLLFVHAVDGLPPGLYALLRGEGEGLRHASVDAGTRAGVEQEWMAVAGTELPLYRLNAPLDLRRVASQCCCHQAIAGWGAFSLGMLADLDHALAEDGAWAYRRLHWEAGLIGQALYLEAGAAGLSGTGIGCFFDDEVHRLLGLAEEGSWQTMYHFTVGKSLVDMRLVSEPPYAHLARGRASGGAE